MKIHKYQQVCAGGLILNGKGEALFVKRSGNDDFLPDYWEIPGGGTDYGEDIKEALKREVKEECGIDIFAQNPLSVSTYYIKRKPAEIQRVEIIFLCRMTKNNQPITLSHEHSDYKWLPLSKVSELKLSEYMAGIISDIQTNLK